MAAIKVSEGYLSTGFNIISLDECCLDHNRSESGQLQADASRFPSGIKALADYVSWINFILFGVLPSSVFP